MERYYTLVPIEATRIITKAVRAKEDWMLSHNSNLEIREESEEL
nr:hypothetical protein [Mesoaciditoga lauensis]